MTYIKFNCYLDVLSIGELTICIRAQKLKRMSCSMSAWLGVASCLLFAKHAFLAFPASGGILTGLICAMLKRAAAQDKASPLDFSSNPVGVAHLQFH